jgi:hypothetical protein
MVKFHCPKNHVIEFSKIDIYNNTPCELCKIGYPIHDLQMIEQHQDMKECSNDWDKMRPSDWFGAGLALVIFAVVIWYICR